MQILTMVSGLTEAASPTYRTACASPGPLAPRARLSNMTPHRVHQGFMLSLRFKGHVNIIPTREWDSLFQGLSGTLSGKGFSAFILHLSRSEERRVGKEC